MPYFFRIEREQDLIWLQNLLGNSIDIIKRGGSSLEDAAEHIVRVYESVMSAVPGQDVEVLGISNEFSEEDKKGKVSRKEDKGPKYKYNHCKDHPFNQIARAPSTDCKGCWVAYKKLHPEKYDVAKRNFDRKKK